MTMTTSTSTALVVTETTVKTSSAAINRKIKSVQDMIGKTGKAVMLVQEAALAVIEHCQGVGKGDCTGAERLVHVLADNAALRATYLQKWFSLFSPIVVEIKAGQVKARLAKEGASNYRPYNLDGARATIWNTVSSNKNTQELQFNAATFFEKIQGLIKSFEGKVKKGEVSPEDAPALSAEILIMKDFAERRRYERLAGITDSNKAQAQAQSKPPLQPN